MEVKQEEEVVMVLLFFDWGESRRELGVEKW